MKSVALGCLTVVICACSGPTRDDLLAPRAARFIELGKTLDTLLLALPPAGAVLPDRCDAPLDPRPIFDKRRLAEDNVAIVTTDEIQGLAGEERMPSGLMIALHVGGLEPLVWGVRAARSFGVKPNSRPAEPGEEAELDEALRTRWIVIERVRVASNIVVDLAKKTFTPPDATVELFVFGVADRKLRCTMSFRPSPGPEIETDDTEFTIDATNVIQLQLKIDTTRRARELLTKLTGGHFEL